jgi:5-methylcytosine-specific restriction protein A
VYDQQRGSSAARGYSSDWTKLRNIFINENPLCAHCLARGEIKAATLVDHIVPVRVAPERRLDKTNLQSLDDACHAIKSEGDRRRWPGLV